MVWIRLLRDVTLEDVASVGGKNASLGEMLRELAPLGVRVPDGFAVTADAFRALMRESRADAFVKEQLAGLAPGNVDELTRCSERIRAAITRAPLPRRNRGRESFGRTRRCRASTARRPPTSPFDRRPRRRTFPTRASPGSRRATSTCAALRSCSTPCATPSRASSRRARSATASTWGSTTRASRSRSASRRWCARTSASAGVIFTLDPETGHRGVMLVTSSWGLGRERGSGAGRARPVRRPQGDAAGGLRAPRVEEARHEGGPPRLRRRGPQASAKRARRRRPSAPASRSRTATCSRSRAGRRRSRTTTRSDAAPTCRWTSSGPRTG